MSQNDAQYEGKSNKIKEKQTKAQVQTDEMTEQVHEKTCRLEIF